MVQYSFKFSLPTCLISLTYVEVKMEGVKGISKYLYNSLSTIVDCPHL